MIGYKVFDKKFGFMDMISGVGVLEKTENMRY